MDNNNPIAPKGSRDYLNPLLDETEGFRDKVYNDQREIPTIGHGFNLNAEDTANIMSLKGLNVDDLKSGRASISKEQSDDVRNTILDKKEGLLKQTVNEDIYNNLSPNKQAALMSLMYNSPGLIGPGLVGSLANGDDINSGREIMLNSNKKKDPGIMLRRIKEAEMFSGDKFNDLIKSLTPEELYEIQNKLGSIENEGTKADVIKRYGEALGLTPKPLAFTKTKKLFN